MSVYYIFTYLFLWKTAQWIS